MKLQLGEQGLAVSNFVLGDGLRFRSLDIVDPKCEVDSEDAERVVVEEVAVEVLHFDLQIEFVVLHVPGRPVELLRADVENVWGAAVVGEAEKFLVGVQVHGGDLLGGISEEREVVLVELPGLGESVLLGVIRGLEEQAVPVDKDNVRLVGDHEVERVLLYGAGGEFIQVCVQKDYGAFPEDEDERNLLQYL